MKNRLFISLISLSVLFFSSCDKHFLKDESYRTQVHAQFEKRQAEAINRSEALFAIFEKENLSTEQREALEFLYAYMPLSDLADYDGDFFLKQVDAAFKARDYFPWGKTVSEDVFRHFVLVYRVNNEYLDTARVAFFEELKDRVKDLSMYEAALEVNHWCHEKVTYRGTDPRTSAPLALVRTSWGRCGEESTFTTTALRAVGIPARQCYTPRWVHTDDNHAWVEVWVDGQWHYLGACEPEPELDVAWFTGPAKRAMMVHTNVFGLYTGPEEKNRETPLYSIINLLGNYAETRVVNVQVTDKNGQPVEGAKVRFKVYNYAEFYTIAESITDKEGKTSIVSGKGDLMIWANNVDYYGYKKSEPQDEITVVQLNRQPDKDYEESLVMNVPPEQPVKELSPEKIAANAVRLASEDSIRNAYMNTFIKEEQARQLAQQNQLNPSEVWKYLNRSQGNWQEISRFILQEKDNPLLFPFLGTLNEKDLRDTPADYLSSYLHSNSMDWNTGIILTHEELIVPYVFSPRIEWELIRPWSNFSQQQESEKNDERARKTIHSIIDPVKKYIKINDTENYYNCPITPRGVYELQVADRRSRNIFFVALCRSQGIPARIETATGKPQYFEKEWIDAAFEPEASESVNLPKSKLRIQNASDNLIKPGYYTHYTLAVFKDGDFQTLDFEDNPLVANFPYQLELDEGYYRLMVGSRANDGSVSISTTNFHLKSEPKRLEIRLPETEGKLFVKGIVDMNTIVELDNHTKQILKELAKGKGLMLCFVDVGKEPSKHILQDLPAVKQSLDEWGGGVLLMTPDDKAGEGFDASVFKGLPERTAWGIDNERKLLQAVAGALQIDFHDNFPLTVYLSRNGGILYSSAGYRIGAGEAVLKIIKKEYVVN
ncbi:MAG: transglutaminase domain-containing protein [Candidatus Symbiothrix sp.]|jgi:transglutaminase-like putative cysteine protease|nr:transglutaminase domain-containing protein [Candidatus Symbiothrix sp.]